MRKILLSAICLIATIVNAKTSVMASNNAYVFFNDATKGFAQVQYTADCGYGANWAYEVDEDTNAVTASATAGIYSQLDLEFNTSLYGLFDFSVMLSFVPFAYNPVSTSASWTHPIAVSQGEEMTGVISAGYDFNIGDVQVYYYINNLNPKVSVLDYILGVAGSQLYPGDITQSTFSNMPYGYAWNQDNTLYTADPYLNFNLGDWISENTEFTLIADGDYIEPIDLFAEYNETK